jgi:protein-L-isoaspartate(D-aspartate) O-methyltransferase
MVDDVAAAFDETPASYGTGGDFHTRYAQALVRHAQVPPGASVLDVATGTAPAAIAAAQIVGEAGAVTGVDISAGMLAHARRNVAASGAGNVTLIEANGARLPFDAGLFDTVLCSSSLVWFPDIRAALQEWRRVLRPGGRIAFSTMAASALPLGTLFRAHLRGYGIEFPDLNEPLNTPEKCRRTVRAAGLGRVTVGTARFDLVLENVEAAVNAGSFPLMADPEGIDSWLRSARQPVSLWASLRRRIPIAVPLTSRQLARLDQEFRAEVAHLVTPQGVPNPLNALFVVAES